MVIKVGILHWHAMKFLSIVTEPLVITHPWPSAVSEILHSLPLPWSIELVSTIVN